MSSDACGGTQRCEHRIQILKQGIAQLGAELWAVRQKSLVSTNLYSYAAYLLTFPRIFVKQIDFF